MVSTLQAQQPFIQQLPTADTHKRVVPRVVYPAPAQQAAHAPASTFSTVKNIAKTVFSMAAESAAYTASFEVSWYLASTSGDPIGAIQILPFGIGLGVFMTLARRTGLLESYLINR